MASIKSDHKLIRTVPYRNIGNLIFTEILTGFTGPAIIVSIWIAIIAAVFGLAGFLLKIHAEERILTEKFGEEYFRYKREVKELIQYVL